jgi:hypothetical protein
MTGVRARALSLYKPPFRFESGYIWDAGGQMVADQDFDPSTIARVRGWGRICSMPQPEALQDEVGKIIAEALTAFWGTETAAAEGTK